MAEYIPTPGPALPPLEKGFSDFWEKEGHFESRMAKAISVNAFRSGYHYALQAIEASREDAITAIAHLLVVHENRTYAQAREIANQMLGAAIAAAGSKP